MFSGRHFPKDIILLCVRWYLAYPLSYRNIEEMMLERGIKVDHATINRWVIHYSPQLEQLHRTNKPSTGLSMKMDETYIKVKGAWYYLYRAVDKEGHTIDFLFRKNRNKAAARAFTTRHLVRQANLTKSPSTKAAPTLQPFKTSIMR